MPANVPTEYRAALLELLEARCDRRDGRKGRFEHAMKTLNRALAIADADSGLRSLKRLLNIDRAVGNWRMVCSWGPEPLPRPEDQFPQKFQYKYVATGGESVMEVAERIGLENPAAMAHPTYGYELHMRLRAGDAIFVPLPKPHLEAFIERFEKLIETAEDQLKKVLEALELQQKDLEATLMVIEAVSIGANLLAGGVFAASIILKAAEAETAAVRATMRGEELLRRLSVGRSHHWNAHFKRWALDFIGHTAAEFLGLGLEFSESVKAFTARHPSMDIWRRMGPVSWLSPNFWTPLFAAGWEGVLVFGFHKIAGHQGAATAARRDAKEALNIFWRGVEAHADETRETFRQRADSEIDKLLWQIEQARAQLNSTIYKYTP